ncbi:MAG TPA: hypothetical protein VIU61_09635 [Kofleriaceae bacterium]
MEVVVGLVFVGGVYVAGFIFIPRLWRRRCRVCARYALIPTGIVNDAGKLHRTFWCARCGVDYVTARGDGYVTRADWNNGVREAFPRAKLHD